MYAPSFPKPQTETVLIEFMWRALSLDEKSHAHSGAATSPAPDVPSVLPKDQASGLASAVRLPVNAH
jgi:hypothetical protein